MIYDRKTNQFRAANGKFIRRDAIRAEIESAVDVSSRKMAQAARDFVENKINLPEFQIRLAAEVKRASILSASVSKGGYKQMSPSDWGKLGNELKRQYQYLNRFAREIEQGRVTGVKLENRAKSYAQNIRMIYLNSEKESFKNIGKTECRRILHSLETCPDCASWAAKGWVGIDLQPLLGTLQCKSFDRCSLEYR